ncbi:restriction endonuclease [Halobacillus shinanisalinarum]|uniref:Restriction endonuclease n=1 Tax=Halobacillus shinanisalinarum TaxID=2932258 RepID=A0ABY4GUB3_9BACI|nr:restriction endonuclease [Halobacillus shinanisalinarum]UOQ91574.1 restriction endonuclease [Halobacillus shinanisalinarum]
MGLIEMAAFVVIAIALVHLWIVRKSHHHQALTISEQIKADENIKKTLAMGLYYRFKKNEKTEEGKEVVEKNSELFIKEDPISFERFVANVFEMKFNGTAWVTNPSWDFGVDFDLTVKDEKYLAQVKCYKDDIGYEPIALLHSNVIKEEAAGGYIITTGSFNENARTYARGLKNIELIDGVELVEYWLAGVKEVDEELVGEVSRA